MPRPRERGRRPRLGLFGLCRFFGQTLAAVCPAASGATVSAARAGAAAARAGQATAARAFRTLSFFSPNPSRGVPGGERGDGLGRGGRVPRPRERGRRTRLGLFGLCRFFGQTLAAVCPAASGATVSAARAGAAAARAGQATAARAFRTLSFFRPNPSRGVPGGERGDGLGRGGRVPRPRERGRRPRLGLFGLCRFFGQTLAAVCPGGERGDGLGRSPRRHRRARLEGPLVGGGEEGPQSRALSRATGSAG